MIIYVYEDVFIYTANRKNIVWGDILLIMIVKVPIYLRLSVPKIQNLIIRPVQNMDRWKRYSRAMGNSKRAIIL